MIEIKTKDQLKSLTNKLYRAMRNNPNMKLSEFRDEFAANTPQQNWNALLNHFDTVAEDSKPCTPDRRNSEHWYNESQLTTHMTTYGKSYIPYVIRTETGAFKKLAQECIHQAENHYIYPLAVTENRDFLEVLIEVKLQSICFMFRVGNTPFDFPFELTDKVDFDQIKEHCLRVLDKLRVAVEVISSATVANYISQWSNVIAISQCTNNFGYITTSHPKNNSDVLVEYDENYKVVEATYLDSNERGDMVVFTDSIVNHFQIDVDKFVVKHDLEDKFRAVERQSELLKAFDAQAELEGKNVLTMKRNKQYADAILTGILNVKEDLPHMEVGESNSNYLDIHFSSKLFDFPEEAEEDFRDLELSMTYDISDNSIAFSCHANDGDGGFDESIITKEGKIKQDESTDTLCYGEKELTQSGITSTVIKIVQIATGICLPTFSE
ncbi:hypothetical protein [Vibrio owensii]|uniref:hypothetical protein n=1 Tax=Vibrio owensii TaxID=696485 RepID=UPI003CC66EA6